MILRFQINEGLGNATKLPRRILRRKVIDHIKYLNYYNKFKNEKFYKEEEIKIPFSNKLEDVILLQLIYIPSKYDELFIENASYDSEEFHIKLQINFKPNSEQRITFKFISNLDEILEHELRHWYQLKFNKDPKMNYLDSEIPNERVTFKNQQDKDQHWLKSFKFAFLNSLEIDSYLRGQFLTKFKNVIKYISSEMTNRYWASFIDKMMQIALQDFREHVPAKYIVKMIITQFAPKAYELLNHIHKDIAIKINAADIHKQIYQYYMREETNQ